MLSAGKNLSRVRSIRNIRMGKGVLVTLDWLVRNIIPHKKTPHLREPFRWRGGGPVGRISAKALRWEYAWHWRKSKETSEARVRQNRRKLVQRGNGGPDQAGFYKPLYEVSEVIGQRKVLTRGVTWTDLQPKDCCVWISVHKDIS